MSSHMPWNRIPQQIRWNEVGNGSIYNRTPMDHETGAFWSNPTRVKAAYGRSIVYSLNTLTSFVQHYGDKNLVMVVLGDHQPLPIVSGENSNHDVPISIIAHDPSVLKQVRSWGWNAGLRPKPDAPGLADERVPQPLPHGVRLATGDPVARRDGGSARSSATATGRPGRHPGPGRAVRRGEPHLPAGISGLPGRPRAVLGGLVHLRAVRGRRIHRAVRLLPGPVAGPPRLATRRDLPVRAPAGSADPAGVLGRARLQPRGGVADRRSARARGARPEVGRRQRTAGAEPRRRAQPQRGVLVDGRRGPAVPPVPAVAADWCAGGARSSWSPRSRSSWRRWGSSARTYRAWTRS